MATAIMDFAWRIENAVVPEEGFALSTGEPGLGKSVALRLLADRLDGCYAARYELGRTWAGRVE